MTSQAFCFGELEAACGPFRGNACSVERLADIYIAQTRHNALIEEGGLDLARLAFERHSQGRAVEIIAQGFWPQSLQPCGFARRDKFHKPETARIVESNTRAAAHLEDDMVMFGIGIVGVGEAAGLIIPINREAPRHAQMHEQAVASGQLRLQEFGTAGEARRDVKSGGKGKRMSGRFSVTLSNT